MSQYLEKMNYKKMKFEQEISKLIEILEVGGTILYPSDTVWGLGCDATSEIAVSKIYEIKKRKFSKSMIVLVSGIEMLNDFVGFIPNKALDLLKKEIKPLTIIYSGAKNLAKNVISDDGTIAIRIPKDDFCLALINEFKKPIISTSANVSGEETPLNFRSIKDSIKSNVDYIVKYRQNEINESNPSIIVKIEGENLIYLRK